MLKTHKIEYTGLPRKDDTEKTTRKLLKHDDIRRRLFASNYDVK